ncbi:hypothetical protein NDU88_000429 [Pleurodeles waltl]|uniref:C-type lectin domain-containing protein n=1 Tax=Pleurodeles waltl TaxID=8319 RepID=A0AAV7P1B5_PLEWA|nr:hypothetical protein NDU88_000429 [Pleurodeles waltl]
MDPLKTTDGETAKGAPLRGAEEEKRRFCRLKDELDRQHWTMSSNLLELALLDVKNALWRSAHVSDRKALWTEVFQWVLEKVPLRETTEGGEILGRLKQWLGLGGETDDGGTLPPLKGEMRRLSAVLEYVLDMDPPLSIVRRVSLRLRRWCKLDPESQLESDPPQRPETPLRTCLELCQALSLLRSEVFEALRNGNPGELDHLEEELEQLSQRCENLTNDVMGIREVLKGSRVNLDERGATTEAPEKTPKSSGETASEELTSLLIEEECGADARCDLKLSALEPRRARPGPSFFQGFWNSILFWRLTTFLFFALSLIGSILLLSSHTPPSVPSSRTQTPHGRDGWMPSMNKYFWNKVETSWDISSRLCLENGGRLAVLHDELKMDEIFKEFGRRYPWIGLSKSDEEFQWIDGFSLNPNMTPVYGYGDCAYLRKDGIFLNECSMRRSSLCQIEPYD